MDGGQVLFSIVFVMGMFSGVFIIYMGLRQRSQQLEMHHRERMAMIERGQIPLADPESSMHVRRIPTQARSSRSLSIGIIVVGLGLAIMAIIAIAGESPEIGVGVGGAIAILGAAFILLSFVVRPESTPPRSAEVARADRPSPPSDL